jgi:hypothetical protein
MLEAAERRAAELRQMAEDDAREIRVSGTEDAVTLYRRMEALERPLNDLLTALRQELDSLASEFRSRGATADQALRPSTEEPGAQQPGETEPAELLEEARQAEVAEAEAAEVEKAGVAEAEVEEAPSPPLEPPSPAEEALPPGEGARPPEEGTPAPKEVVSPPSQATVASRQAEEVEKAEVAGAEVAGAEVAGAEVAEVEEAPSPPPEPPSPPEEDLSPGERTRPPEEQTPAPEEVVYPSPQETVASRQVEEAPPSEGRQADDQAEPAEGASGKRGLRGLLRRKRPFITTPGDCAVCHRSVVAGSEQALAASGWVVRGDLGICPQCQSDGWQLPEGARLPHRRARG